MSTQFSHSFHEASAQASTPTQQNNGPPNNTFAPSKSLSFSIEVEYPHTWEEVKTNFSGNIVVFRPKPDTASDKPSPVVGIYAKELPYRGVSLEEYTNTLVDFLKNQSYYILISNRTILAELPAYRVVYVDPSKVIAGLQIWTIKDDYVYTIMYLANQRQYATYLPYANSIIHSIKIIPSNTS